MRLLTPFIMPLLFTTPAFGHDHWSDLDGDGLLEPDEYGLETPFDDADLNGDGIISSAEYDAVLLRAQMPDLAVPQGEPVEEPAPDAKFLTVEDPSPNVTIVGPID